MTLEQKPIRQNIKHCSEDSSSVKKKSLDFQFHFSKWTAQSSGKLSSQTGSSPRQLSHSLGVSIFQSHCNPWIHWASPHCISAVASGNKCTSWQPRIHHCDSMEPPHRHSKSLWHCHISTAANWGAFLKFLCSFRAFKTTPSEAALKICKSKAWPLSRAEYSQTRSNKFTFHMLELFWDGCPEEFSTLSQCK